MQPGSEDAARHDVHERVRCSVSGLGLICGQKIERFQNSSTSRALDGPDADPNRGTAKRRRPGSFQHHRILGLPNNGDERCRTLHRVHGRPDYAPEDFGRQRPKTAGASGERGVALLLAQLGGDDAVKLVSTDIRSRFDLDIDAACLGIFSGPVAGDAL